MQDDHKQQRQFFQTKPAGTVAPVHEPRENQFAEMADNLNRHFGIIGGILADIKKSQDRGIGKQVVKFDPNNDLQLNFRVYSIYVDNSQNANALNIVADGGKVTFTISANSQQWIHPLGTRDIQVTGTGTAWGYLVDTFLPI